MTAAARRRPPFWIVLAALAAAAAWAGFLGLRHLEGRASVLDRAEAVLADLRLLQAGPRPPPANVVIVVIDDATVAAAGGYPLDRRVLAGIVRAIGAAGARALAVDLMLIDPTTDEADRALAEALAGLPTVIAAAGRFPAGDGTGTLLPVTAGEIMPQPAFAAAAAVGLVNVASDAGGTPRHLPMVFRTAAGLTPSFALRAAGFHAGADPVLGRETVRIGAAARRLDLGWHLPLRYFGPEATIVTISAANLMGNEAAAGALAGRTVVLGATATAVGDRFSTPFDGVLPGVEVLATGIAHLIDGSGLVRDTAVRRLDAAATLALAACGVLAVTLLPLLAGAGLFAALAAGWMAAITVLFAQGWWLSAALPLAGALPPVAAAAVLRQMFDRRQARLLAAEREALGRLQAPVLAARIAQDPGFLRTPREQRAAILFADLSGFTGLSERLGPVRTRDFLKAFHSLVVTETQARGGLVMAFMGDGAMIVFGVPDEGPDDAARALAAAFALVAAVRAWIGRAGPDGDMSGMRPGIRVGAHCGTVVLSRLGHDTHQHITATGDAVNVASRLMEVGKAHDAVVAASCDLLAAAGGGGAGVAPPDAVRTVPIRGRREPMEVAFWGAAASAPAP